MKGSEDLICFVRPQTTPQAVWLAWPAHARAAYALQLQPRELDTFELAILSMVAVGQRNAAAIAQVLCLDPVLVKELVEIMTLRRWLDGNGNVTGIGAEIQAQGMATEAVPRDGLTLQDPFTGRLWPILAVERPFSSIKARSVRHIRARIGTHGDALILNLHVVAHGDGGRTPIPETSALLEACAREWVARPPRARGEGDIMSPDHISLPASVGFIDPEPFPILLARPVVPAPQYRDREARGWHLLDPIDGLEDEAGAIVLSKLLPQMEAIAAAIDALTAQHPTLDASRRTPGAVQVVSEHAPSDNAAPSELMTQGDEIAQLVSQLDEQSGNPSIIVRSLLMASITLLEGIFQRLSENHVSLRGPEDWEEVGGRDAMKVVTASFIDKACRVGFIKPIPARFTEPRLSRRTRHAKSGLDVMVSMAIADAAEAAVHPVRRLAAEQPGFLSDLDLLIRQRNTGAAHAGIQWERLSGVDARRVASTSLAALRILGPALHTPARSQ